MARVNIAQELRELAEDATTAAAAGAVLLERHPELSPAWMSMAAQKYLNQWCRDGVCERQRIDGQPTVFQMRQI